MKRWVLLLMFPYIVSVIPKEGNCIRYSDANPRVCEQFSGEKDTYEVEGIAFPSKGVADDFVAALNKAHTERMASDTQNLPPSDEPIIKDDVYQGNPK